MFNKKNKILPIEFEYNRRDQSFKKIWNEIYFSFGDFNFLDV